VFSLQRSNVSFECFIHSFTTSSPSTSTIISIIIAATKFNTISQQSTTAFSKTTLTDIHPGKLYAGEIHTIVKGLNLELFVAAVFSSMPKIVGRAIRVVEHGGLSIDELVGNAATKEDGMSIARAIIAEPSAEPWLTVAFDEWMCVLQGRVEIHSHGRDDNNEEILVVNEGETCHVSRGERFKPVFPVADTEYILTCLPAFSPDRCVREDKGVSDSEIAQRLRLIHEMNRAGDVNTAATADDDQDDKIYHMCQKSVWDETLAAQSAYFPPTFVQDGCFTHATAEAARLISTANHYSTSSAGDWICLELSIKALKRVGIITRFEGAAPVGETATDKTASDIQWPHIYGGIPAHLPGIVTHTFPMKRDSNGTFVAIEGIVNDSKAKS
jgi:mannose-6-phosphate isomerase-like protein (cupin superfamily)